MDARIGRGSEAAGNLEEAPRQFWGSRGRSRAEKEEKTVGGSRRSGGTWRIKRMEVPVLPSISPTSAPCQSAYLPPLYQRYSLIPISTNVSLVIPMERLSLIPTSPPHAKVSLSYQRLSLILASLPYTKRLPLIPTSLPRTNLTNISPS